MRPPHIHSHTHAHTHAAHASTHTCTRSTQPQTSKCHNICTNTSTITHTRRHIHRRTYTYTYTYTYTLARNRNTNDMLQAVTNTNSRSDSFLLMHCIHINCATRCTQSLIRGKSHLFGVTWCCTFCFALRDEVQKHGNRLIIRDGILNEISRSSLVLRGAAMKAAATLFDPHVLSLWYTYVCTFMRACVHLFA